MRRTLVFTTSLFIGISAYAISDTALLKKAEESGLKAIPKSQLEILKLVDNPKNPITDEKVELGKKLFIDPRLSKSGLISCNTCHNLSMGGVDGIGAAVGHRWTPNPAHLNSPTVFNSVLNKSQFWDGRDPHLEAQAQGPIQAGPEMAAPKDLVEKRILSMPGYVDEFKKAYGDDVKIDFGVITETIAVFERTLITPSRYDAFLNGDMNALNTDEKEGLKVFIDKGCVSCHNDIGLGGTMMPFNAEKYDLNIGGFTGTKDGMIKTPTLRNIEETAPYFHNGNVWSLSQAVKLMGDIQLGMKISDSDTKKIVTFLNSLTGDKPIITYPTLPVITGKTPKPDMN